MQEVACPPMEPPTTTSPTGAGGLGRRARQKLQRRATILDRARELFDAHGYDDVSVEALAEAADVSLRTLYNFFPAKLDILVGVHARLVEGRLTEVLEGLGDPPADPVEGLYRLMEAHFRVFDALDRDLLVRTATHGLVRGPQTGGGRDYATLDALSIASVHRLMSTYADRGALGADPDVDALARLVFVAANGEFFLWAADRGQPVDVALAHVRRHVELALQGVTRPSTA